MKKTVILITLISSLALGGCATKTPVIKTTNTSEATSAQKATPDADAVKNTLVDYISLFIFDDNMIGNISYNFKPEMNEETYNGLHALIDQEYTPRRDNLSALNKQAEKKLDQLGFDKQALTDFKKAYQEVTDMQDKWSKLMVGFTKENAVSVKETIDQGTATYLQASTIYGSKLSQLLIASGFDSNQTMEIALGVNSEAGKRFGDPADQR